MKHVTEYRRRETAQALAARIAEVAQDRPMRFMEVCGGHTATIHRFAIGALLPPTIELLSGPGCPVCVTPNDTIDWGVAAALTPGVTVATFGDLVRVPGSRSSLAKAKGEGGDVRICFGPFDALDIARKSPDRHVVFMGIGFETTAPAIAAAILAAHRDGLDNLSVHVSLKTMPTALGALVGSGEVHLDGMILPGHVSTITGADYFDFLARDYSMPGVVSGFEPADMLQTILMLAEQVVEGRSAIENQYRRSATRAGNRKALAALDEVFEPVDVPWRGLGTIPGSGLGVREEYRRFDAIQRLDLDVAPPVEHKGCICGDIMRGAKAPRDCPLFGTACTPDEPRGACMVSREGSCQIHFTYGGREEER